MTNMREVARAARGCRSLFLNQSPEPFSNPAVKSQSHKRVKRPKPILPGRPVLQRGFSPTEEVTAMTWFRPCVILGLVVTFTVGASTGLAEKPGKGAQKKAGHGVRGVVVDI